MEAFSLVEVAMALGIISISFVALLGLMPTGLNTFRASVDTANETWIAQGLNSMIQVTEWDKIDDLDFEKSGEVYYYDEEGRLTDTEKTPSADPAVLNSRIYGAKLLVEKLYEPGVTEGDELAHGRRVVAVIVNVTNPTARTTFDGIHNADELRAVPADAKIRSRAFLAMQMGSDQP
jgi:uncharacterized protein (TIGR02598 family)